MQGKLAVVQSGWVQLDLTMVQHGSRPVATSGATSFKPRVGSDRNMYASAGSGATALLLSVRAYTSERKVTTECEAMLQLRRRVRCIAVDVRVCASLTLAKHLLAKLAHVLGDAERRGQAG